MRTLILLATAALVWINADHLEEQARELGLLPESARVAAAVHLRCGGLQGDARNGCGAALRQQFSRGTLEPAAIVRLHCQPIQNAWSAPSARPAVCDQLEAS